MEIGKIAGLPYLAESKLSRPLPVKHHLWWRTYLYCFIILRFRLTGPTNWAKAIAQEPLSFHVIYRSPILADGCSLLKSAAEGKRSRITNRIWRPLEKALFKKNYPSVMRQIRLSQVYKGSSTHCTKGDVKPFAPAIFISLMVSETTNDGPHRLLFNCSRARTANLFG